jgi:hypothetical protein
VREDGLRAALAAGVDVIAHGEEIFVTHLRGASDARLAQPDAAVSEDDIDTAVRAIREAGAYVTPNLSFIAMTARLLDDAEAVFADPEFARLALDVQQLWRNQHPAGGPMWRRSRAASGSSGPRSSRLPRGCRRLACRCCSARMHPLRGSFPDGRLTSSSKSGPRAA